MPPQQVKRPVTSLQRASYLLPDGRVGLHGHGQSRDRQIPWVAGERGIEQAAGFRVGERDPGQHGQDPASRFSVSPVTSAAVRPG